MKINAERLAYWYLRFNGFLTIENFVLHDEASAGPRTEFDLLAFRFPNRKEALRHEGGRTTWMQDDAYFSGKKMPFAAFVEVTVATCKLNSSLRCPRDVNVERALRALGALADDEIEDASSSLYKTGRYVSRHLELGFISFGVKKSSQLKPKETRQIIWRDVMGFIFRRFKEYEPIKQSHKPWAPDGRQLWDAFIGSKGVENDFVSSITVTPG